MMIKQKKQCVLPLYPPRYDLSEGAERWKSRSVTTVNGDRDEAAASMLAAATRLLWTLS